VLQLTELPCLLWSLETIFCVQNFRIINLPSSQRRPRTNVGYLRTGVSGKRLYSEGNPINSPPGRQENPLARISTSSNEASQISISFFKCTRALREDISKICEGLVELNLIFQHNHRLSWTNNLLWNIKINLNPQHLQLRAHDCH
jgi:hypothetical protein